MPVHRVRPVISGVIRRGKVPGRVVASAELGPGGNTVFDPYYGSGWVIGGTAAQRPVFSASPLGAAWSWQSTSGYLQWNGALNPPFSVEMAVIPTSLATGYKCLFRGGATGSGAPALYLGGAGNGSNWNLYFAGDVFSSVAAVLNTPYWVLAEFSSAHTLYIDGNVILNNASAASPTTNIRFGVDGFANPIFPGYILFARIYGQAMGSNAKALYQDWYSRFRPDPVVPSAVVASPIYAPISDVWPGNIFNPIGGGPIL